MKTNYFLLLLSLMTIKICAGQSIADSCFTSVVSPSVSFSSSADLAGVEADLMQWTGSSWTGAWSSANITIAPPIVQSECRAIFVGNGTTWTTGGEAFAVRLNQPLVTGQVYTFNFTYVSHGYGSDGHFNPKVYSDASPSFTGEYIDTLPGAGYNWTTNTFSFTANANQSGHTWITVRTDANTSSGIVLSFCPGCQESIPTGGAAFTPQETINIFPNPFQDELFVTIQKQEIKKAVVTIKNTLSQVVFRAEQLNSGNKKIAGLGQLPGGVYFLDINVDGERVVKKLWKE